MPVIDPLDWKQVNEQLDQAERDAERFSQEKKKLRDAIKRALGILDRNLGHQTEKCYDAVAVLNQAIRESE